MDSITTHELTKKYGENVAVNNLNLRVKKGELFALLGVNGAGKTTTIKMLSCLIKPTSGDAILLGDSIVSNPYAIKKKTNISPQETAVAENLSVLENLEFIAEIYGQDRKSANINALEITKNFGLENELNKKTKKIIRWNETPFIYRYGSHFKT